MTNILAKVARRAAELTDPRFRAFYFQRYFLNVHTRDRISNRIAARRPTASPPTGAAREAADALAKVGFALTPGIVTPVIAGAMRSFFSKHECSDPYRPHLGRFRPPAEHPPGVHVAYYDAGTTAAAPHMFEVMNHPTLIGAAGAMLGATPTLSYMAAWWSLPAGDGQAQQAENFHRDVDDWRFVKFFSYLSDVDDRSGPHIYVPGSHLVSRMTKIRRYTDREVAEAFGADNQQHFTGPAGTAFLENTFGLHRGTPVQATPRLMIQATYSLGVVPYGPRRPVAMIGAGGLPADLDPYINRVYCAPSR